jgi:hypothetical protein
MTMLSEGITMPKWATAAPPSPSTSATTSETPIANRAIFFLHAIKNATQAARLRGGGHLRGAYAVAKKMLFNDSVLQGSPRDCQNIYRKAAAASTGE